MEKLENYVLKLKDGIEEMIGDLEGASRTILIDEKTVGAEDITFGHSKFEPHTSVHKKHIHSEAEEIMYMLKGRGISGVNETETEISAGDTVWVPRAAVHWFYNPFDEPCEFIFIYTRKSLKDAGYEMAEK
jgi:quercetin dioxygenase-like cupin family protein